MISCNVYILRDTFERNGSTNDVGHTTYREYR
jgi:hypothetical protein